MRKTLIFILFIAITMSSCVSKKLYTELQTRHNEALAENEALSLENQKNMSDAQRYKDSTVSLLSELSKLKKQNEKDRAELLTLRNKYDETLKAYTQALKSKENLLDASSKQSREYLENLKKQEENIASLTSALSKKEADLKARETRVAQLEGMISNIQGKLSAIKNSLTKALVGFEGKGLTISQRNGKIYVSLENRLLFPSGSWQVNEEGKRAIDEITKVLVTQPNIKIMIEGHTDNVPYKSSGNIRDNWDLSVMRATTIVRLVTANKNIDPKNITAAGRSQYEPLLSNTNADNRARNRRTEVIITPDLSSVEKMLEDLSIE
ncbi:MAG: OmpA family protein [Flavobacteriales bacterium]|nr:OmpA family protein [Flavobacteriales bacterium]